MNILVDAIVLTGRQHNVCEDYVLYGNEPFPYVVVSDGCSSSEYSHVGSMMISHAAVKTIKNQELGQREIGEEVIRQAASACDILGIDKSCLDATHLIAYMKKNQIEVFMYGDGCILVEYKSSKANPITWYYRVDYDGNAPYYLSYNIDERRRNSYSEIVKKNGMVATIGRLQADKADKVCFPCDHLTHLTFPVDDVSMISIVSDGLFSFLDDGEPLDFNEVYRSFVTFKTVKGSFVQRRVGRQVKMLKKKGIEHMDDLSFGTILIAE